MWRIPLELLQETLRRHLGVAELCPDAIVVQAEVRFLFANPEAARLCGAGSAQEWVARSVMEWVHQDASAPVAAGVRLTAKLHVCETQQARGEESAVPLETTLLLMLRGPVQGTYQRDHCLPSAEENSRQNREALR
jgi:hypothetical protein